MSKQRLGVFAILMLAILAVVLIISPDTSKQHDVKVATGVTGEDDSGVQVPAPESTAVVQQNVQIADDIYDRDLAYRTRALASAENTMQHYDPDSYLRWRALNIEPGEHISGSYLSDNAMPKSISLTPFPDVSVIADQTNYQIFESSNGAIWTGKIRGPDNGSVEISIAGGESDPGFVIRFRNYSKIISIFPTDDDTGDVYVAVEGNPHQQLLAE